MFLAFFICNISYNNVACTVRRQERQHTLREKKGMMIMGTTQPIRDKEALQRFKDYYQKEQPMPRNYALIQFGLHTALRISDILLLHWSQIYDFDRHCYLEHISIREKKTGKETVIALNSQLIEALEVYRMQRQPSGEDFIFTKSADYQEPLCRSQAYRIVRRAAEKTQQEPNISCHSLRKTFGYHAWKQGTPPALLMDIYNHSSYRVTKKYLGISQDERDSIFLEINL